MLQVQKIAAEEHTAAEELVPRILLAASSAAVGLRNNLGPLGIEAECQHHSSRLGRGRALAEVQVHPSRRCLVVADPSSGRTHWWRGRR